MLTFALIVLAGRSVSVAAVPERTAPIDEKSRNQFGPAGKRFTGIIVTNVAGKWHDEAHP